MPCQLIPSLYHIGDVYICTTLACLANPRLEFVVSWLVASKFIGQSVTKCVSVGVCGSVYVPLSQLASGGESMSKYELKYIGESVNVSVCMNDLITETVNY